MTRRLTTMAIIPFLVAATAPDTPDAAFERYRSEINLHDFDRLARGVIASDARFVFAGEKHQGIDAVRASFNRTWATIPDEVYTMDEAEWLSRDRSSALVAFRYRYRGTMANGRALAGGGYGTNLYRRTPEGWRLAYEHLSPDPALTPKPAK
jgi:ketosteroid isomerase-like protein